MPDNASGVLLAQPSATGGALVLKFNVGPDGSFKGQADVTLPTGAAGQPVNVTGTIVDGILNGRMGDMNTPFTANVQRPTGNTAEFSGLYVANATGSASGTTYLMVGPAGEVYLLAITPGGISSEMGTVSVTGAVAITGAQGVAVTGAINPGNGNLTGRITVAGVAHQVMGLSAMTERTDRMANGSLRVRVMEQTRTGTMGFYVGGNGERPMLIRAVGPGLAGYGIQDPLNAPRLRIYDSKGGLVADNTGWQNDPNVAAACDRLGAFKLNPGSSDCAVVAALPSGAYTAYVTGVNANGVALVEVYDAARPEDSGRPLTNLSANGYVGRGDDVLVTGFVITGNAPKRVLIRGIGPALAPFGVSDALANPMLRLFGSDPSAPIAQNDDWGSPQPVGAGQVAATAADLQAAAAASGAFPLTPGSRDSAIVITLPPGNYTAIVSGAGDTTGTGLVEFYELPNR
jgi:hypothetical protein